MTEENMIVTKKLPRRIGTMVERMLIFTQTNGRDNFILH